jgi:hypothetical protein
MSLRGDAATARWSGECCANERRISLPDSQSQWIVDGCAWLRVAARGRNKGHRTRATQAAAWFLFGHERAWLLL